MTTVVFLGPSLPHAEAQQILPCDCRPPVRRGDLERAVADGARAVGIIDGEFGTSLTVTIGEIKRALEKGVQIFGAGSMGALRAAECAPLGMLGVGWIYRQYSSGAISGADEVALVHDPATLRALTVPLANFRWTVGRAVAVGIISADLGPEMVAFARNIPYWNRTLGALDQACAAPHAPREAGRVVGLLRDHPEACDRKRLDAIALLEAMGCLDRQARREQHAAASARTMT